MSNRDRSLAIAGIMSVIINFPAKVSIVAMILSYRNISVDSKNLPGEGHLIWEPNLIIWSIGNLSNADFASAHARMAKRYIEPIKMNI